jgi:hypothetical protein
VQAKGPEKPKEEKDEVDESKFDEFMGNDTGKQPPHIYRYMPGVPVICSRRSTMLLPSVSSTKLKKWHWSRTFGCLQQINKDSNNRVSAYAYGRVWERLSQRSTL